MQTPKTQFGTLILTDKAQSQLRVTQGNLQQLKKGDILQVLVPKIIQGKAHVNIQGKSIILEGLSKYLQHKTITLKVLKTGIHPQLEFLQVQHKVKPETREAKFQTETKPQPGLKQQKTISPKTTFNQSRTGSKQVNSKAPLQHQAFTAQFRSSPPAWLRHAKQPLTAIVTEHQGKRNTLRITPPEMINHAKYTTAATTAKQHQHIHIENPARPIQIGEQFNIQLVAPHSHGKPLLWLQPRTSHHLPSPTAKPATNPAPSFTLPVSKIIIAEVKQRLTSGHITFQWKNQSFEAPAPQHIQPGDILHLQVVKTEKKTAFNVLGHVSRPKAKAASIFRQHIGNTTTQQNTLNTISHIASNIASTATAQTGDQPPGAINIPPQLDASLSSLSHWIDNYALNMDQPVNGQRIATLLQQLGQHYESSLAQNLHNPRQDLQNIKHHDLKAILLELIETSRQHTPSSEAGQIGHAAEQGVARIESQQVLNLMAAMQSDPIRFELPMVIAGQLINVYLSIQQEHHGHHENGDASPSETQAYNILFALNLTGLGALRIDARITHKSVNARFYHDSDTSRRFVQQNIQRLEDTLQSLGYHNIYLGAAPQNQMTHEKQTQFTQLLNNAPGGSGLLDVEA